MKNDTQALAKKTADQLLKEGIKPTQQNVRKRMGCGSITTINKALNSWWAELGERLNAVNRHPDLPDAVAAQANKLWQEALIYADKTLEARKQEIEQELNAKAKASKQQSREEQEEIKELRAQCIRLLKDAERLTNEKHQYQLQVAELENKNMAEKATSENLKRELKQARIMAEHGASVDELIELKVSNQTLKQENKRLVKQIDALINDKSTLALEITRLELENQKLKSTM